MVVFVGNVVNVKILWVADTAADMFEHILYT